MVSQPDGKLDLRRFWVEQHFSAALKAWSRFTPRTGAITVCTPALKRRGN
jgi:hypothetical protein